MPEFLVQYLGTALRCQVTSIYRACKKPLFPVNVFWRLYRFLPLQEWQRRSNSLQPASVCVCNVRRIGRYSWITRTCNGRTASGPVAVHMGKVIVISAFKPNRFADRKARGSRGESSFYGTTSKSKIGTRPPEVSLGGPGIDLDGPHASFGGPSRSASTRKHPS